MSLNKQELLDLKDQVEEAKTELANLSGQQTALLNQLKTDWDCNTLEEANALVKKQNQQIETLDEKIQTESVKLEKLLNDND